MRDRRSSRQQSHQHSKSRPPLQRAPQTLTGRLNGRIVNKDSKRSMQKLTTEEEESIVKAIYQLDA